MYTCIDCGGMIEELGEMALSSGGCVCAQKKAEESANHLQQLKAEIAALAEDISTIYASTDYGNEKLTCIVKKLRQLSAV